jgi:hypothetical protein
VRVRVRVRVTCVVTCVVSATGPRTRFRSARRCRATATATSGSDGFDGVVVGGVGVVGGATHVPLAHSSMTSVAA